MATLHDRDHDISDYRERSRDSGPEDREISLGTGTILGIFFALALLCAIFFGIGYSTGRKSAQTTIAAANSQPSPSAGIFSSFKPSAGSPAGSAVQAEKAKEVASDVPRDPDSEIVTSPVTSSDRNSDTAKPVTPAPHASYLKPANDGNTAPVGAMPPTNPSGTTMVQVAAVSHQEDADTLIAALKQKGYAVFIRRETQDHLLHVQVGPFATRKDGDAMRQHLLADGYNAIVK